MTMDPSLNQIIDREIAKLKEQRTKLEELIALQSEVAALSRKARRVDPKIVFDKDSILRFVSARLSVPQDVILSHRRTAEIIQARWMCIWLARQLCPTATLSQLASAFGQRDHSVILYAEQSISERFEREPIFKTAFHESLTAFLEQGGETV